MGKNHDRAVEKRKRTGQCPTCRRYLPDEAFAPRGVSCRQCTRAARLRQRYGISANEWRIMKMRYEGKCWVCQENPATVVDHCHEHGHVRGLLCDPCNKALGQFQDDPDRIMRAVYYLLRGPLSLRKDAY